MGKSHLASLCLATVALFTLGVFCSAANAGEQASKVGSPVVEQSGWSLPDKDFDIALKWLKHKEKEKKAQSIDSLREEKLEEMSEEDLKDSLGWLEEKDPQAFAGLQKLHAEDPAQFAGEVRSLVEREIRKTLSERKRVLIREMIFGVVGGLGLFLFGMVLMSEGLRKGAGPKLKSILESMTKKSLRGFFVGAGVTALIQSSSATTVIIVGLVNAGLLTLKQAIGVIIGSNVGTTATAWLVSASGLEFLDISMYSMPAIGIGFLLYMGGRTRKWKSVGEIMLGFGILFLGIDLMKGGFASLEDSPRVQQLFISLGDKPVWALLAGLGLTTLIQSSSASIAIVQLLAMGGAFSTNWTAALNTAIPFVLGANIGTTITAQLAALQANRNGKRAAWAHTMFNVFGSVIAFPFVYLGWYGKMVLAICPWGLSSEWVGATIAVAHSFFNIVNSCIFLPLSSVLGKAAVWLVPVRPTEAAMPPVVLEKHLLDAPEIAIEQTKRQIVHMAKTAKRAFSHAIEGIMENNRKKLDAVKDIEDVIDSLQFEITSYLSALAGRPMADGISVRLPVFLHAVNDLERVGDHAMNIMEIAQRKIEQKLTFSDSARVEAQMLRTNAEQMFDDVIAALETGDIAPARAALTIEKRLNEAQVELRRTHVGRMSDGACSAQAGLIFIDLVDNVEKIGDHLTNIAQAVIGGLQWEGIKPKIVQGL